MPESRGNQIVTRGAQYPPYYYIVRTSFKAAESDSTGLHISCPLPETHFLEAPKGPARLDSTSCRRKKATICNRESGVQPAGNREFDISRFFTCLCLVAVTEKNIKPLHKSTFFKAGAWSPTLFWPFFYSTFSIVLFFRLWAYLHFLIKVMKPLHKITLFKGGVWSPTLFAPSYLWF